MVPIAVALVTVPIYIKLVGPDRYGVLAIAWLLLGYFGLFDLGLGRATSFRIAALRDAASAARSDTFWAALIVNIGMGLVGGVVLWIAARYFFTSIFKVKESLRPEILASVPLLAISVPVATVGGVLAGALQGREKFFETNVVSATSTILFQIFPLTIAWAFGPNLVLIWLGALAARMVAVAVLSYYCHIELLRGNIRRIRQPEIRVLLKYGGWVTATSVFGPLLVIVDRFAIGAILGAVAVGIYAVPFNLAQRIQILPGALTTALFPKMSAVSSKERAVISEQATRALAGLITLPVLVGVFIFTPFLHAWVGADIGRRAAPVGRILLIAFWANAIAYIPSTRLQAAGRPDLVAKVLLAEIPPYFIALYFGMKYFGLAGCAMAFCGRCVVDFGLLTWVGGGQPTEWKVFGFNLSMLVLGTWLSVISASSLWYSCLSALVLCTIVGTAGWKTLPAKARYQIVYRADLMWQRTFSRDG